MFCETTMQFVLQDMSASSGNPPEYDELHYINPKQTLRRPKITIKLEPMEHKTTCKCLETDKKANQILV